MRTFHRSASCDGERCTLCGAPADLKVGEEIMHDDPMPSRHNWTAYICAPCGRRLFFPSPPTADAPREPTLDDATLLRDIARGLYGNGFYRARAQIEGLASRLAALVAERDEAVRECEGWRWAHWGHPEASWACRCGAVNGAGINQCVGYETECGAWRPMKPKILAEVQAGAPYDAAMVERHRHTPERPE
jgi:hypothetical protein